MSQRFSTYDIAIIGGGIIGMATAMSLSKKFKGSVVVLESENELAAHQTGHNSGVIHSGLYYKPGSLKAINCKKGRECLYKFLKEENIPHEKCGKIVVATSDEQIQYLHKLKERGTENGLKGLKTLNKNELKEFEPHVSGVEGMFVPETGIVDYKIVTNRYGEIFLKNGGEIKFKSKVKKITKKENKLVLKTSSGEVVASLIINCGGLYSDRIAKMSGIDPGLKIIPFRGEYYKIKKSHHHLVKNLIYPVPDPKFPFLGVHFTRMIGGGVEAGPNAVTALKREGYTKLSISIRDILDYTFYLGFWRMAKKHWKIAIGEYYRSFYKPGFVKALKHLVPEIKSSLLKSSPAGVRAQALEPDGTLVDDFRIKQSKGMIHVLNAPSPAATSSISIGQTIADSAIKNYEEL